MTKILRGTSSFSFSGNIHLFNYFAGLVLDDKGWPKSVKDSQKKCWKMQHLVFRKTNTFSLRGIEYLLETCILLPKDVVSLRLYTVLKMPKDLRTCSAVFLIKWSCIRSLSEDSNKGMWSYRASD